MDSYRQPNLHKQKGRKCNHMCAKIRVRWAWAPTIAQRTTVVDETVDTKEGEG